MLSKFILQWAGLKGRAKDKKVVFVAGVQRSGTNMLMEVLERCFDAYVFNDWDSRAFDKYEMRPPGVIHSLVENAKSDAIVFKILLDLQYVKKLMVEYDPVKVLWIVRDYRDVVNSHLLKWKHMSGLIQCIIDDRNSVGWRGRDLSDNLMSVIRELYHPDMNEASACALFWYFRNLLFFEQGLDDDPRALVVSYEQLVTRPGEVFPDVFRFLGLRYSARVTKKVFSSSIEKRPSPDIEPAIALKCSLLMDKFTECRGAAVKTVAQ